MSLYHQFPVMDVSEHHVDRILYNYMLYEGATGIDSMPTFHEEMYDELNAFYKYSLHPVVEPVPVELTADRFSPIIRELLW